MQTPNENSKEKKLWMRLFIPSTYSLEVGFWWGLFFLNVHLTTGHMGFRLHNTQAQSFIDVW